jgi:hypothetical protein
MRKTPITLLILFFGVVSPTSGGDLRVSCAPGLEVFVDGEAAGVSTEEENGLLLTGVSEGEHTIRVETDGPSSTEFSLVVDSESHHVVFADYPSPAAAPENAEAAQGAGAVVITSDIPRCWIEFAGLRIQKREDTLAFVEVPTGVYEMWLQQLGTLIETTVTVKPAATTRVTANFEKKRAEVMIVESTGEDKGEEKANKDSSPCFLFWVEVISTSKLELITGTSEALEKAGYPLYQQNASIVESGEIPMYKLRVGPFANQHSAKRTEFELKKGGAFPSSRTLREPCPK